MNIVVSKTHAMQIRRVTWVLYSVWVVYFCLMQFNVVGRPSHLDKEFVRAGVFLVLLLQGYGLWVTQKWQKAECKSAAV